MRSGGRIISLGVRATSAAGIGTLLSVVAARGAEATRQLPPDSDPLATLAVVALAIAGVTGWQSLRGRRTPR